MMVETDKIKCYHCGYQQHEDIYDLVDVSSNEGEFEYTCEACGVVFTVQFEFVPFIKTEYA